jgi:uncharacterized protein
MPFEEPLPHLDAFLKEAPEEAEALTYNQLLGFLFAVCSAPDMVMPSQWIGMVFDPEKTEFANQEEAEKVTGDLMMLYNEICREINETGGSLPKQIEIMDDPLENFNEDAPLREWAVGFFTGHQYLSEMWDELLPKDMEEELDSVLMPMTFFIDRSFAEGFIEDMKKESEEYSLEGMAAVMIRLFPDMVTTYGLMGRTMYRTKMGLDSPREGANPDQLQKEETPGRNDPCPCGSGKKFKNCCMTHH